MHHNRRKKKRVNYGVRVVELVRGTKGFGFTISGQQPCILSCIVQGSPAENAGLRAGDYLIAVNGHNVSKVPHDDVVQLIGYSNGILRLQIAENYYSDSSDEEGLATVRSKHKYAHKPRTSNAAALQMQCRVAKVVRDLHNGATHDTAGRSAPQSKMQCGHSGLHYRWNLASPLPPPPPPASHKRDSEKIVHRTVVGYLGTIDIPNQLHPSSMMQVLRKSIKRLKAEKRNPTTVLLTIHVANIKLTNSENRVIAEYPSYKIIFCNSFSEQDKQYFGILTKSGRDSDDIVSNSCHVFTIYYKLIDHAVHFSTCNIFGFTCTKSSEHNVCQEFPDSCNGLIGAIQTLYISDSVDGESHSYNERRHQEAASPQPSNVSTSTAHSSNSDSGIGFKDDYGSHSDKNIGIDYSQRHCPSNIRHRNSGVPLSRLPPSDSVGSRLTVRAMSDSRWNGMMKTSISEASAKAYETTSGFSDVPANFGRICNGIGTCAGPVGNHGRYSEGENASKGGDTTTCPGPSASMVEQGLTSMSVGSLASVCTTAMLHGDEDTAETSENSTNNAEEPTTNDLCNKLSPKVYYGMSKSLVHSLEDLNPNLEYSQSVSNPFLGTNEKPRPWGSLQEIRNVGGCASDNCMHGSTESCDKSSDCKNVHSWANGFEKLLEDPKGLQTFAEFLKKEFSHENIYFWAACERYKDTEDTTSRRRIAWQIYQRHLSSTAAEPVNVDSHASGQIKQELLNEAPATLFLQAQKQVFNLMKFDSYPRFLRSDLYRHCLETGSGIVSTEDCDLNLTSSPSVKLKKSHSDAEDRCRKSILPWHRKNRDGYRSKSKDRGESEYNKVPSRNETIYKSFTTIKKECEGNNNEDNVSISSSRSSLASWDLALRQSFNKHSVSSCEGQSNEKKEVRTKCTGLCRVILPDGSTTVVPTSQTESIKDVVTRLLDKRALRYSNYDVLIIATNEMISTKYPSAVLSGQEVEVVPAKALKVDLPSRRVITVIAHKGRTLKEVLKPLLNKYGFSLELISVWGDGRQVSLDIQAINAPTRLVLAANNEDFQRELPPLRYSETARGQPTLDEITNKVFEELLVGKGTNKPQYEGSCKSDDQRSESSSVLSSKFFLRDSTMHGKKKGKSKSSSSEKGNTTENANEEPTRSHPPLIAKWRNGVKLQLPGRFDGDELYEGLKRAQRSRLEDQRGTEINFELPDFLKVTNKENGKSLDGNKFRRPRVTSIHGEGSAKFYDLAEEKVSASTHDLGTYLVNGNKNGNKHESQSEGLPVSIDSTAHNSESLDNSSSMDTTLIDGDQTVVENGPRTQTKVDDTTSFNSQTSPTKLSTPPPLPPKPKSLLTNVVKNRYIMSSKRFQKSTQAIPVPSTETCQNNNIF